MSRKVSQARYGTYQRGAVTCAKCGSPIYIYKLGTLANEFSVSCRKCGHRTHADKSAIRIELMPERRKRPRAQ
jgi:hypothetical protein